MQVYIQHIKKSEFYDCRINVLESPKRRASNADFNVTVLFLHLIRHLPGLENVELI